MSFNANVIKRSIEKLNKKHLNYRMDRGVFPQCTVLAQWQNKMALWRQLQKIKSSVFIVGKVTSLPPQGSPSAANVVQPLQLVTLSAIRRK